MPPPPSTSPARGQSLAGPNPWDLEPPDGIIDLMNDIFHMADQFDHSCQ